MKDYTDIFRQATENSAGYDFKKTADALCSLRNIYCGDYDEWGTRYWVFISREDEKNSFAEIYGYISVLFPVALLKENCPEYVKKALAENNILFTELVEPMSCDEDVLRKYVVWGKKVFDENFVDGEYSYDDERFYYLMERFETGYKSYIDSGCFEFHEIVNK